MSKKSNPAPAKLADAAVPADPARLLADLRAVIEQAHHVAATAVNTALTLMHWRIGQRIRAEVLKGQQASYGEEIVSTVSRQLTADHGRSFSSKSLRHMMRFSEAFPDEGIVSTLSRHLAWSHFRELIQWIQDHWRSALTGVQLQTGCRHSSSWIECRATPKPVFD